MKFSQMTQRVGNRFKQRLVPFVNGVYGKLRKLASGNPIVITDASDESLAGLRVFGKSTQNGTPTPDAPVEIVSVENPTVKVDAQSLSVPYTLHGIPVTAGGNYTDANGQQWICDEVDFERGMYVQRIKQLLMDGSEPWKLYSNKYIYLTIDDVALEGGNGFCTCVPYHYSYAGDGIFAIENVIYLGEVLTQKLNGDITTWTNILTANPAKLYYILTTPIETPLTADQIAAYKSLHTNKPNTTILNDQDAWMEVSYIAK